jgi:hypothetical protein
MVLALAAMLVKAPERASVATALRSSKALLARCSASIKLSIWGVVVGTWVGTPRGAP